MRSTRPLACSTTSASFLSAKGILKKNTLLLLPFAPRDNIAVHISGNFRIVFADLHVCSLACACLALYIRVYLSSPLFSNFLLLPRDEMDLVHRIVTRVYLFFSFIFQRKLCGTWQVHRVAAMRGTVPTSGAGLWQCCRKHQNRRLRKLTWVAN